MNFGSGRAVTIALGAAHPASAAAPAPMNDLRVNSLFIAFSSLIGVTNYIIINRLSPPLPAFIR
jgi:hypothetical protein